MTRCFLIVYPALYRSSRKRKDGHKESWRALSTWTRKLRFSGSCKSILKYPGLPPLPLLIATFPKETLAAHPLWCLHPSLGRIKQWGGPEEVFCILKFILSQHLLSHWWTPMIQGAYKTSNSSEEGGKLLTHSFLLNHTEILQGDPSPSPQNP